MLISIDGIDGCGESTRLALLAERIGADRIRQISPSRWGSPLRLVPLLLALLLVACPGTSDGDPGSVIDDQGNVAQWAIGVPDPEATMVVMELAGLGADHTLALEPTAELLEARRAVLALGVAAVPSIAQQVRNSGCRQPQSAELFALLAALAKGRGFEASRAIAVTDLALSAATGPLMSVEPSGDGFEALVGALATDAEGSIASRATGLEGASGAALQARGEQLCVGRALDLARSLHDIEKIGAGNLQPLVEKHLATLPNGDPRAIELVELIDATAPEDRTQAEKLQDLTLDQTLHPRARAVACSAAIERRSRMDRVTAALRALPGPVVRCLLLEGRGNDWWDTALARDVLVHDDLEVRLAAIDMLGRQADGDDFELLRLRLEDAHPADPVPGLRERDAVLRAAAEVLQQRPEIRQRSLKDVKNHLLRAEVEGRIDRPEEDRPQAERLAVAGCEVRVEPGEGAAGLTAAVQAAGPGGTVCAVAGTYAGDLVMDAAGAKLVSLTPGLTVVGGHLVLKAPTVLVGFAAEGSLLVGPAARGSVLAGARARGQSLVETDDALLVDVVAEGGLVGPWIGFDGALHVPDAATGLFVRVGDRREDVGAHGGALGWMDLERTAWLTSVDRWRSEPPVQAVPRAKTPGLWSWMGVGLPLPAPDRYQQAPMGRWAAVWAVEPGGEGVAVPLVVAPWWRGGADWVVGIE